MVLTIVFSSLFDTNEEQARNGTNGIDLLQCLLMFL